MPPTLLPAAQQPLSSAYALPLPWADGPSRTPFSALDLLARPSAENSPATARGEDGHTSPEHTGPRTRSRPETRSRPHTRANCPPTAPTAEDVLGSLCRTQTSAPLPT